MIQRTPTIGLLLAVGVLFVASPYILGFLESATNTTEVTSSGDLSIYADASCTRPLTRIDWGALRPGEQKSHTLFIRNHGSSHLTLAIATSDWTPTEASAYLTIAGSGGPDGHPITGQTLPPNGIMNASITLIVASNVTRVSDFMFIVTLTGHEATS